MKVQLRTVDHRNFPDLRGSAHLAELLTESEAQPLKLCATTGGHFAVALGGGRMLNVLDFAEAGEGVSPAAHVRADSTLSVHTASPVVALHFCPLGSQLHLVAMQADGGIFAWEWMAAEARWSQHVYAAAKGGAKGRQGLQAQTALVRAGLLLPPADPLVAGAVASSCVGCTSAGAPLLLWLEAHDGVQTGTGMGAGAGAGGQHTLRCRALPLCGEEQSVDDPVWQAVTLGHYAQPCRLYSAGGAECWLYAHVGVAYRWSLDRRCALHRVDLYSIYDAAPLRTALHFPSNELLALMPNGELLAIGPRIAAPGVATAVPEDREEAAPTVTTRDAEEGTAGREEGEAGAAEGASSTPQAVAAAAGGAVVERDTTPHIRCVGALRTVPEVAAPSVWDAPDDSTEGLSTVVGFAMQGPLAWVAVGPSPSAPQGALMLQHVTTGAVLAQAALPATARLPGRTRTSVSATAAAAATGGGKVESSEELPEEEESYNLTDAGVAGVFMWGGGVGCASDLWQVSAHVPSAVVQASAPLLQQDSKQVALGGVKEVQRNWELLQRLAQECDMWGGSLEKLQGALVLSAAELELQGAQGSSDAAAALAHPLLRSQTLLPGLLLSAGNFDDADRCELHRVTALYDRLYPQPATTATAGAAAALSEEEGFAAAAKDFSIYSALGAALAPRLRAAVGAVAVDGPVCALKGPADQTQGELDVTDPDGPFLPLEFLEAETAAPPPWLTAGLALLHAAANAADDAAPTAHAQAAALWEQLSAFGPDDFHTAVAAPTASATRAGVLKAEAEAEGLAALLARTLCRMAPSSSDGPMALGCPGLAAAAVVDSVLRGEWVGATRFDPETLYVPAVREPGGGKAKAFHLDGGGLEELAEDLGWAALPAFEALCVCLYVQLPAALATFVRQVGQAVAAEAAAVGGEGASLPAVTATLAHRALLVLPPAQAAPLPQPAEPSLRTFVQAELLCLARECTAATWILLTIARPPPPALDADAWELAALLVARVCEDRADTDWNHAAAEAAPLMLEVFAQEFALQMGALPALNMAPAGPARAIMRAVLEAVDRVAVALRCTLGAQAADPNPYTALVDNVEAAGFESAALQRLVDVAVARLKMQCARPDPEELHSL